MFEVADILKSLVPNVFGDQLRWELLSGQVFLMHTHHQRFFVVASVKDSNAAALRQTFCTAPEKIVVEFFGGWNFEGGNFAALRIPSRHYMLDRAVFAGRVH